MAVIVDISSGLLLVILMIKTQKRTLRSKRPEYTRSLLNSSEPVRRTMVEDQNNEETGPFLKVKF